MQKLISYMLCDKHAKTDIKTCKNSEWYLVVAEHI